MTLANHSQTSSSRSIPMVYKVLMGLIIILLIGLSVYFAVLWQTEKNKVEKFEQASVSVRELVATVDNNIYGQFTKLDERGHAISTATCGEIVASNNYRTSKPEYVRMVENGICDPNSDVFKPNYTAFTPILQEKVKSINAIYNELGIEAVPSFADKPNTNYLFDTCWDLIEAGECDIDTTF